MELDNEKNNDYETTIRPTYLKDFIGQTELKEMFNIYINSAKFRNETLDHVLLYGPPGLGKTTLAHIIANEMGVKLHSISAPTIERVGDLLAILSSLESGDILFIDEIHRLGKTIEEVLYSAMEDFSVDVIIGKDTTATSIKIDLPPFTLIGATTRCGDISNPLRDRFGIIHQINYYSNEELTEIIKRSGGILDVCIDEESSFEIACRSRGTPRIANRIFRRVRDYAQFINVNSNIPIELTKEALKKLNIDKCGLTELDQKYLKVIINMFNGGPVGIASISAAISEEINTIEDICEPYLLQEGFIIRTAKGRKVTEKTYKHLGIEKYESRRF